MNNQPKIAVEGKEYLLDSLSDDAKAQLGALNMTNRKLVELQQEMAIPQTARMPMPRHWLRLCRRIDPLPSRTRAV